MSKSITRRQALALLAPAAYANAAPNQPLVIAGKPVEISLTPISPLNVRVAITPLDSPTILSDGSLVKDDWGRPADRIRTLPRQRTLRCGKLKITLSPDPLTVRIETQNRLVQQLRINKDFGVVAFELGDSPLLGLGEGGPQFDRRGSADRMRSGQGGFRLRTHGGRVPVPWLIGTGGWAMFIHQPFGTFDFTGKEGKFIPRDAPSALPLDMFVIGAQDPAAIMAEYARLTGLPEMAPLWSFGYQQSHRTLASREELLDEAKTFREKRLPCDTLIYLGTGFCPSGWNVDNGQFGFNKKVFPDPKEQFRQLHDLHFKVALHVVIKARALRGTVADRCDPRVSAGEHASCHWQEHRDVFALGVDGWWPDEGDPLDIASRLTRNRMYWDGPRLERPNERPFALHRNGYAGMQRYASFLWSGDVYSTWETLKTHIPVAVNTGLTGIPYWGTDIGGFVPTKEFTGELYVRWFQFAAFNPLFRSHGRTWKLRLPWGWNTGELGPNEVSGYGEAANPDPSELHNAAVEPICRKYLELRYQLLPYLYSAVRETCETGMPIVRALWLHYPDDAVAVARGDEFLWGRDILVAPVVEKGATSRKVYLPRGAWYDFWTQERIEGGREISCPVDLAAMPLYVRAGAIVPVGPVKQYTEENVDGPLTVWIYPGADAAFTFYEDDGRSFDYKTGAFMKIRMAWNDRQRRLSLSLVPGSKMLSPEGRKLVVRVAGGTSAHTVLFDGKPLEVRP